MGIANNDFNWRLVAAVAIPENTAIAVDAAGKAIKASGTATATRVRGICPQAIAAGERCPVIRCGTISGLVGFSAGNRLGHDANGALVITGSKVAGTYDVAIVKSEDATLAVILTANLDDQAGPQI